ncbi:hypothetical protein FVER53590_25956 [Fusarium verticillioides]|nr:hypothetical protein FVER53590_25956 [Fusarium verticillioides]
MSRGLAWRRFACTSAWPGGLTLSETVLCLVYACLGLSGGVEDSTHKRTWLPRRVLLSPFFFTLVVICLSFVKTRIPLQTFALRFISITLHY